MSVLCPSVTAPASLWSFCGARGSNRAQQLRNGEGRVGVRAELGRGRRGSDGLAGGVRSPRRDWVSGGLPLWRSKALGVGVLGLSARIRLGERSVRSCFSGDVEGSAARGLNSSSWPSSSLSDSLSGRDSGGSNGFVSRECESVEHVACEETRCNDNGVFIASVARVMRNMGKALALGVVVAAIGFGPRVLSGIAVAAPAVAEEETGELEEEEEVEDRGIELSEAEVAQLERQDEVNTRERERQLRAVLGIDKKLEELEALGEQAEQDPSKEPIFLEKLREAVRGTYVGGRQWQGQKIVELNSTIEQLRKERDRMAERAERGEEDYLSAKAEFQKFDELDEGSWEQREALELSVKEAETQSGELWQRVLDLETEMMEKQMWVQSALLEDLPRIEEQGRAEFERVYQRWLERQPRRQFDIRDAEDGMSDTDEAKMSRLVKDLEVAGETYGKESLLSRALGMDEDELSGIEVDAETESLLDKIKSEQERSLELRAQYESLVRERLGLGEDEDISHVREPELSEIVPSADDEDPFEIGEDRKASVPDVKQKQAAILVARDRVMAQTWFNKEEERWEMSPMAASHAVTMKLVAQARIRHDRKIFYLMLKGDDREYLVDIPAMDAELAEAGGFDSLYIKMTIDEVPTATEYMWIPLKEWPVWDLFQLPFKAVWWVLEDVWNSPLLTSIRPYYFKTLSETFEEIMVRFGFPVIQTVLPLRARVALGFDLPEGAEVAEPTDIMIWQQEAQRKTDGRYGEGTGSPAWWISLPLRTYVVGIPLYFFVTVVGGLLLAPFSPQKLAMNAAEWKEKKQEQLEKEINRESKKDEIDPIKNVFDKMKRVKHPQVRLQDFAGIDAVKEEINEVISFLRNPKIFKEMGARPPRGVLIVGGPGTGKTTLAFAIAAEARVPMVELQGAELEGGAWVGQGASNVRELFKTARELSPLIIFMDDFDHFAGVRGATSDTRKQDHESLINQLLVELDGFETQEGVVLIATTSRPYAIDEALRRPGRMDRTIELPMPNIVEREQILRKVASETMDPKHVDFVDWAEVADKTAGLTPAQLKCVPQALEGNAVGYKTVDDDEISSVAGWLATFNQVLPMWFRKTKLVVKWNEDLIDWLGLRLSKEDLDTAVETMDVFHETRPGIELENPPSIYMWTREYKFPHAVWAAGRALTAFLLPGFDTVDQAWLDPTSWDGIAFTKLTKQLEAGYQETGTMTRSYYEKSLVLCFGPYIAGRLLLPFGENNNLSKGELENAEEIAAQMVMQYGWGPDDSPLIYAKGDSPTSIAMGDKHEWELATKIQKLYHIATDRCGKLLQRNQPTLNAVVEHLLQYDCVTTKDLARICEETGAIFEEEPFELVPYSRMDMLSGSTNGTTRVTKTLPAGASAN
ncbi:hypothetical protein M758_1G160200 [Ceratodon purpureus]|nr:hypothetical protein M758_1G160200 [Ceratodon purpureus]